MREPRTAPTTPADREMTILSGILPQNRKRNPVEEVVEKRRLSCRGEGQGETEMNRLHCVHVHFRIRNLTMLWV